MNVRTLSIFSNLFVGLSHRFLHFHDTKKETLFNNKSFLFIILLKLTKAKEKYCR